MEEIHQALLGIAIGIVMFFFPKYFREYSCWEVVEQLDEQTKTVIYFRKFVGLVIIVAGVVVIFG